MTAINICVNSSVSLPSCKLRARLAWRAFQQCKDPTRTIYDWEWYINDYFTKEATMKSHHSCLFAQKLFTGLLELWTWKPCRLGRPFGSVTLFEHAWRIYFNGMYSSNTSNTATWNNHIFNASGSAFSLQTLCRAMYRLGITRKKVSRSQEAKIYSLLPVCLVTLNMLSSMW